MKLYDFAFMRSDWLKKLADLAVPENWGEDHRALQVYCETNFDIAYREDLLHKDEAGRFALWRVGTLTTSDGTPIYAYFPKNRLEGKQAFAFVTFLHQHSLMVTYSPDRFSSSTQIAIQDPPKEPDYRSGDYHPDYKIEYSWGHMESDHSSRLEQHIPGLTGRPRFLCIFGAIELAHRLWGQLAVPQYHHGAYQWFLPLYITHDDHSKPPDLVAALVANDEREVYRVATLLPPDWAYPLARAITVGRPSFNSWLA